MSQNLKSYFSLVPNLFYPANMVIRRAIVCLYVFHADAYGRRVATICFTYILFLLHSTPFQLQCCIDTFVMSNHNSLNFCHLRFLTLALIRRSFYAFHWSTQGHLGFGAKFKYFVHHFHAECRQF